MASSCVLMWGQHVRWTCGRGNVPHLVSCSIYRRTGFLTGRFQNRDIIIRNLFHRIKNLVTRRRRFFVDDVVDGIARRFAEVPQRAIRH
jgi:hypothetical protein